MCPLACFGASSGARLSPYLSGGFAVRSRTAHPPWFDGDDLAWRSPSQLPAELMNEAMVSPTQEACVGEVGFAAIDPVDEVVAIAPVGRTVATGKPAVMVADDERAAQCRRDRAGAATNVDRFGVGS